MSKKHVIAAFKNLLQAIAEHDGKNNFPGGIIVGSKGDEFIIPKNGAPVNTEHVQPDARLSPEMKGVWDEMASKFIKFSLQGTGGKFRSLYKEQVAREILGAFEVNPNILLADRLGKSAENITESVWRSMNRAYIDGYNAGKIAKATEGLADAMKRRNHGDDPQNDSPMFPADMPLEVKQHIVSFLEIAGDDLPQWMEAKIIKGEIPVCFVTL